MKIWKYENTRPWKYVYMKILLFCFSQFYQGLHQVCNLLLQSADHVLYYQLNHSAFCYRFQKGLIQVSSATSGMFCLPLECLLHTEKLYVIYVKRLFQK